MSKTSTVTTTISIVGDGVNETITQSYQNTACPSGAPQALSLSSGANTLTVPTGAVALTIIPPAGNAVTLTLKGVTGDTGVALSPTNPTGPIPLATTVTTLVLTAGSNITVGIAWT